MAKIEILPLLLSLKTLLKDGDKEKALEIINGLIDEVEISR